MMSIETIPKGVFDSIEKVLRYLIPGFIFVFLVKISFSQEILTKYSPNITSNEFYVFAPVFGMVIYNIHRVFLWPVDGICRRLYKRSLGEVLLNRAQLQRNNQELSDMLYYRWAIIHQGLIFSELVFFFTIIPDTRSIIKEYSCPLIGFALILFFVCLFYYFILEKTELSEIFPNLSTEDL
jgi:hypothetical protein